ncbi:guanine deaminase [Weissella sagaensis]|uniref:Guanine deaminase n=1 Tax=Weissella sagaensis TaxID=2559928 RepID=A0ABW1RW32_9LACO|nr:guanine deaminase [Weissella sagaensis]KAA8434469.1 guanine deaminase [Weissella paramesenteroides]KAA8437428.1 guanine deaminase [Weissella paramesenteroides]QDJ59636.1 guanine deaminase [Weissella hellenica]UEG67764.1 guanine deaminase [Weissella hellenica]
MNIIYKTVLKGSYYTAIDKNQIDYQIDSLICIDENGQIANIVKPNNGDYEKIHHEAEQQGTLMALTKDQVIMPGFIDLHVHAPQWPNAGLALDRPLYEWLDQYTFPLEAKFKDADYAHLVYDNLVETLLANGTTTALYFGSVDNTGNVELVKACLDHHQRGFVGKVVMDNPAQTPDYYRDESAQVALDETEAFIHQVEQLNKNEKIPVTPVITPRFLPSCTDEVLAGLGQLATKYNLPIQSHCSESDWENGYALETHGQRDAAVLDDFGLLTDKTVMAHGTLLNDEDLDRFKNRGVGIAHCPISNVYFGNAVMPAKKILAKDVKVGLGTDISGGFDPSIYQNIRQAIMSSRMLDEGVDSKLSPELRGQEDAAITARNAFYMATVGGAQSLNLTTGQVKVGYAADLQIVHTKYPTFGHQEPEDTFDKMMYQTTAAEIDHVMTQGIFVK